MPRVVRFTPDGLALAYVETVGGVGNIMRQRLAGGAAQALTTFDREELETFAFSHTGRLAITRVTRISDVAVMPILPKAPSTPTPSDSAIARGEHAESR